MKFKINLEKLSDAELENFLKLKKAGIIRKTDGELDKSRREQMIEELGETSVSSKYIPVAGKSKRGRKQRFNYHDIAKKMGQIVRNSTRVWSFKELIMEAVPHRTTVGGTDYTMLKPMFEKNLYGIRLVGRRRKEYVSSSSSEKKPKLHISEERRQYMSDKGKYVTSMAKRLVSENPSLIWAEALRRSQIDFNEKHIWKKKEEVKVEEIKGNGNFPSLENIEQPNILKGIIQHLIQGTGKLVYEECSYPLGLSVPEWKHFCSDLMLKSKQISNYFEVENKFKLRIFDEKPIINYG